MTVSVDLTDPGAGSMRLFLGGPAVMDPVGTPVHLGPVREPLYAVFDSVPWRGHAELCDARDVDEEEGAALLDQFMSELTAGFE